MARSGEAKDMAVVEEMLRQLRERKSSLEKRANACNVAIIALEEGFDLPELRLPKSLTDSSKESALSNGAMKGE